MQIKVKKLNPNAKLPTQGSQYAAGYDLYAVETVWIEGNKTRLISTGLSIEIPEGYFGAIYARSGLATKQGLRPANCVGIIDSDYRGPVMVAIHNDSPEIEMKSISMGDNTYVNKPGINETAAKKIDAGQRIAQLVIQKFEPIEFLEVDELDTTERGQGGFGSTGEK